MRPPPPVLILMALPLGCVTVTEGTWTFEEPVEAVVFDLDHGDVVVTAHASASTEVTIHHGGLGRGEAPLVLEDGVLWISLRCALATCGGSLEVALPPDADVVGELMYGDVSLEGVGGDVDIQVQAGALEATALHGEGSAWLVTGAGEIDAQWARRPRAVEAVTGAGAVTLAVPTGPYALDLDMGAGVISLDGITDDPRADARLYVRAGSGEIDLIGE